jgi:hypothetical protein
MKIPEISLVVVAAFVFEIRQLYAIAGQPYI